MSSENHIDNTQPLLRFVSVSKVYPPQRTPLRQLWNHLRGFRSHGLGGYTALQGLDFEVLPGQSLGIVGLNGAGKSTLLQLAAQTIEPSSGNVQVRGRVAALLELGSGFNPEATGQENIFLYAATMGLTRIQVHDRIDSIIAFSGLEAKALQMPVKTYSSGMQVRLAFAVATSVEPDILIVDEALSVGDGVFAKRSFDRVMQLREQGTALLLCSHALFHVDLFCDRTLWLDRGRVRDFGATAAILPRYQEFLDDINRGSTTIANIPSISDLAAATSISAADKTQVNENVQVAARLLKVEISLDGVTGQELRGRSGNSCLEVNIQLQTSTQEPHPRAAVVISSESGKIIGSGYCDDGVISAYDEEGHAQISYVLNQLPLNKGRYRIGVYLLCHQGRYVYEWMDPLAHIELESEGKHQGPWMLAGTWSS
ncbi:polysaccharide ABC transporter ATP-binding protein [Acidovorax temperans]|uniref:ABC transporter ATP-binding protein n=1 Tax=Acidovorax temperans TaxID=80878 RepID=UPI0030CE86A4